MKNNILIEDVAHATGGKILSQPHIEFTAVGTDTRSSLQGQLFVALKGEAHDAHEYLEQAVAAGAAGLLVHRWPENLRALEAKTSVIVVKDTLVALQKMGTYRRQQWGGPIVAITGSNGKTTSKEFLAQILSVYKQVHFNKGSFNNHWGLPLTLLGLCPQDELAICEMGMNHSGEITALVGMATPDIVGVTMVGRAHLEGLGSIAAIADAKDEIYRTENPCLKAGVFNLDNEWTRGMYERFVKTGRPTYTFGNSFGNTFGKASSNTDVRFSIKAMSLDDLEIEGFIQGVQGSVKLSVFGQQNLTNLMFAACAALAAGLTPEQIWKALPQCKTTWGRNQRISLPAGADILFDGYNANPDSQKALIENLKLIKAQRPLIGVFGEMRELGTHSPKLHEELGELVGAVPFHRVFFIGNYGEDFARGFSKGRGLSDGAASLATFADVNASLIESLKALLSEKPIITIKGSRGVRLERILKELGIALDK